MFIRGNGLDSWLRQSLSLLALQKKSAQVFFSFLWMWHILSMASYCVSCQAPPCVCAVTFNLMSLFSLIPVFLLMKHSDNAVSYVRIIPCIFVCLSFFLLPSLTVPAISWAGFSTGEPANGDFCVASACGGCRWGSKWKSQIWPNAQRQCHACLSNSSRHR